VRCAAIEAALFHARVFLRWGCFDSAVRIFVLLTAPLSITGDWDFELAPD